MEHWIGKDGSFTTKYHVHYLVWCEQTRYILNAVALEKEIKSLTRARKESLITELNPDWKFRNEEVLGNWPPTQDQVVEIREHWRREDQLQIYDRLSFYRSHR